EIGANAFDVFLSFDPTKIVTVADEPAGWDAISGSGFAEFFSLNPGAPPTGADVPPGVSLGNFVLDFAFDPGPLPLQVLFSNPEDSENPIVLIGTTTPLSTTVNLPSSISLLLTSFFLLAAVTRRMRRLKKGRS